jgi:hypothetical protein
MPNFAQQERAYQIADISLHRAFAHVDRDHNSLCSIQYLVCRLCLTRPQFMDIQQSHRPGSPFERKNKREVRLVQYPELSEADGFEVVVTISVWRTFSPCLWARCDMTPWTALPEYEVPEPAEKLQGRKNATSRSFVRFVPLLSTTPNVFTSVRTEYRCQRADIELTETSSLDVFTIIGSFWSHQNPEGIWCEESG